MNQTCETGLLSRATLKDRAKGALAGRYGKFILALLAVTLITSVAQLLLSLVISVVVELVFLFSQTAALNLSTEQMLQLAETDTFSEMLMSWYYPIDYVTTAISQIFTSVFNVGLSLFALNLACNRPFAVSDIFYGFRHQFKKALAISAVFVLLRQVISLPTALINRLTMDLSQDISLTQIGILLAILLAGTIIYTFIYLGFSQVYFLFLDFPKLSAGQLIKRSFGIMRGHKMRFLLLELSFLPLMLLSLLTLGIGDLFLTPYMQVTYTFFFLNLMQTRSNTATLKEN